MTDDKTPTDRARFAFPSRFWRGLDGHRPPGVDRLQRWRSPLRGPWLTSVFGLVLLITLPIVILTGLLSYIAYGPQFGQAIPGDVGWLKLPTFDWPTDPSWLYRLNQGLHVGLGLILIPVVLAKLWSVIPRLFAWPPCRSIAQVLERISLLMLVGGILFEIITGRAQHPVRLHLRVQLLHRALLRRLGVHRRVPDPHRDQDSADVGGPAVDVDAGGVAHQPCRHACPNRTNRDGLVAANPAPPTVSRRGALALVGGGALFVAVITAGQTLGGFTRQAALLLPRGRTRGDGPNDFQVNRTAFVAGIYTRPHRRPMAAHPDRRTRDGGAGPRRS